MNQEDLIDKIIRGITLTDSESQLWEQIKDDPEVKNELGILQELHDPLRVTNRSLLKNQLSDIEAKIHTGLDSSTTQNSLPADTKVLSLPKWLYAAASILLLAAATFLMLPKQEQQDHFANFYEPYPSFINPILKGSNQNLTDINEAYAAYENKNFQKALSLFESTESMNDTIRFYQAVSYIEMGHYNDAIQGFKDLQLRDNRFKEEAGWYEALCQLKMNNPTEVKSLLTNIIGQEDHPYAEEAANLLDKIQ